MTGEALVDLSRANKRHTIHVKRPQVPEKPQKKVMTLNKLTNTTFH